LAFCDSNADAFTVLVIGRIHATKWPFCDAFAASCSGSLIPHIIGGALFWPMEDDA
jgi:hypothetical protein